MDTRSILLLKGRLGAGLGRILVSASGRSPASTATKPMIPGSDVLIALCREGNLTSELVRPCRAGSNPVGDESRTERSFEDGTLQDVMDQRSMEGHPSNTLKEDPW